MRYAIGSLRGPGGRLKAEFCAAAPEGTGAEIVGPVEGRLELINAGRAIVARGFLRATLRLECSRCLVEYLDTITIEVNEECALRQIDAPESYQEEEESGGSPCPIPILNEEEIDLTELVRQLIVMHLPLRPLCHPACRGLCPQCGHDLNEGPCRCAEKTIDERWAALRDLWRE